MILRISVEQAQATLQSLIDRLNPGDEVVIVRDDHPVARLIRQRSKRRQRPAPGLGRGTVISMAPDFDEIPEEFRDFVE